MTHQTDDNAAVALAGLIAAMKARTRVLRDKLYAVGIVDGNVSAEYAAITSVLTFSLRCAGSTLAAISLGTTTPINEPIAR